MRPMLKIALFLQIASGAFWTLSLAMIEGRGGLEVLALLVLVYSIQAICFLIGLWAYWRHSEERRKATWLLVLPFVFWFLPGIVRSVGGGRLTESGFVALLLITVAVILLALVVVPRKVAGLVPSFLFRSRVFNSLVLMGPLLGWLFIIGLAGWLFGVRGEEMSRSTPSDSTGYGLASAIVLIAIYLVGLGIASLISGAWSWLSLRSGIEGACRKLNIAQMVVTVPGLIIGGFSVLFMLSQN